MSEERPSRTTWSISPTAVVAIVLGVILVIFAVLNTDDIHVNFIYDTVDAPLIVVIVISALLGAAVSALLRWQTRRRHRQA